MIWLGRAFKIIKFSHKPSTNKFTRKKLMCRIRTSQEFVPDSSFFPLTLNIHCSKRNSCVTDSVFFWRQTFKAALTIPWEKSCGIDTNILCFLETQSLQFICAEYTEIKIAGNKRTIEFVLILIRFWTFSFSDNFPDDVSVKLSPLWFRLHARQKKACFFSYKLSIQRSVVVSCLTSHLPCHPQLKGTCLNAICQPSCTDLGRTCNILVLSFLDSALNPNHSGKLIASSAAPEWNQLAGHEYSHKNHSHVLDGMW